MKIKENLALSKSIWSVTFKMLAKYPCLLLPFLITAVFEGFALTILFYYPRPPLSLIFAPPVKAFFGGHFLHYPDNFLLLPQLFYYAQVLVTMTVGVVMFGMAMGMTYQANTMGEKIKILGNLNRSLRRYITLAGVWLITFILLLVILRGPRFLIVKFLASRNFNIIVFNIILYIGIALVFLIEALFIYSYPAIIIERRGFLDSIKRSFNISRNLFLTTIVLIIVPRILDVIVILIKQNLVRLMNLTLPEITLAVLAVGIAVTFITDSLVFLATANLFIFTMETEKGAK
ncbi:MAG: hypothetical protein FJZ16_07650 [Candidatus Omnitrophica bacterium]|nr:hypothetical protein [Candidatus Omnitrophota bacterium]